MSAPRGRGAIALLEENCTVCMLCARECPDWCLVVEGHVEQAPPAKPGGRPRTRHVLDRFAIDWSLCLYCGICVEVCPFDALHWTPELVDPGSREALVEERFDLRDHLASVPPPPPLDEAAEPSEEAQAAARLEAVAHARRGTSGPPAALR